MEQSPFWEANSYSAFQQIPRIVRNSEARNHIRCNLSLVSVLSQMNAAHVILFLLVLHVLYRALW
jgi:hypothetical protein